MQPFPVPNGHQLVKLTIKYDDGREERRTDVFSTVVPTSRLAPSDMHDLAPTWEWKNEVLPKDQYDRDMMYKVVSRSKKQAIAVVKIYTMNNDPMASSRAQRERRALERLINVECAPQLVVSNVSTDQTGKQERWTLMKLHGGDRLTDYVRQNRPNIQQALQIAQQLLRAVTQIHAQGVVHRDLRPGNVLIGQRQQSNDKLLTLINFATAWIVDDQASATTSAISEGLFNTFYCLPQFEMPPAQPGDTQIRPDQCSPTIDTSSVCAILFWMITEQEPKESRDLDGNAPHKLAHAQQLIRKRLNTVIGRTCSFDDRSRKNDVSLY